jgi:hypothetical protein
VNIGFIILAFLLLSKKTATATPLSARPGSTAANARGGAPAAGKPAGGPAPAGAGRGGSSLLSSVEDFFGFTNLDSPNLINPFDSGPLVSPADSNGVIGGVDTGTDTSLMAGGTQDISDLAQSLAAGNQQPIFQGDIEAPPPTDPSVDLGVDPGSDPGSFDAGAGGDFAF